MGDAAPEIPDDVGDPLETRRIHVLPFADSIDIRRGRAAGRARAGPARRCPVRVDAARHAAPHLPEHVHGRALAVRHLLAARLRQRRSRYPVVYWLHGRGDNECTQVGLAKNIQAAIQSGGAGPMIYVFMNGGASCNFDDTTCAGKAAESYIMKKLIAYIDAHYRTVPGPRGRAIEGFSMGAEAVLRYFGKYTDQFCDAMAYAPIGGGPLSAAAQGIIRAKGQPRPHAT
jgi:hypothetical protein